MDFPFGDKPIRLGILGMTEGNAHPFSWSAIINGYDKEEMYRWTHELYPTIPDYLGKQPPETFGIPGVQVTHVCFTGYEDRAMAENCARASHIPHVVDRPEDMIGQVDAVICATDIGAEHVERCRPFVEAGIPMCPPEGDAGTGMVATGAVHPRTGSISAGTSAFSLQVLERPLKNYYPEIDVVSTPAGKTVAMAHTNTCSSEIDAWVHLIADAPKVMGWPLDMNELYTKLFQAALEGDARKVFWACAFDPLTSAVLPLDESTIHRK